MANSIAAGRVAPTALRPGCPRDHRTELRSKVAVLKLPDLIERIKRLEDRLDQMGSHDQRSWSGDRREAHDSVDRHVLKGLAGPFAAHSRLLVVALSGEAVQADESDNREAGSCRAGVKASCV